MKVSVCVPAYRQVEYLRATLRSLQEQDFDDWELIISDDSPDDSVERMLREFQFGERLRYVRNQPALGSPENWNAALRLARGEYLKIQHHDDQFTGPNALRRFVELLDAHPEADFAFSATRVQHVDSGLERLHCASQAQLAALADDPCVLFGGNFVGAPSATIVRNGLGIEYDGRMKWLVDIDYYYRVLMSNGRFACTPEPLVRTPTNAAHQVTELCRDDAVVEIGEALLLFNKLTPAQRQNRHVKLGWSLLFRRFRMRRLRDFAAYGLPVPQDAAYFVPLLKQPLTRWHLLLQPTLLAKKVFYRAYPHVPGFIRAPLNRLATKLGLGPGQRS